jgi:hypothetical protein
MNESMSESLKNLRLSYRLLLSLYTATLVFFLSPDVRKPLKEARNELAAYHDAVAKFAQLREYAHNRHGDNESWTATLKASGLEVQGGSSWQSADIPEPKTVLQTIEFFSHDIPIFSYAPALTESDIVLLRNHPDAIKAIPVTQDMTAVVGVLGGLDAAFREAVALGDTMKGALMAEEGLNSELDRTPRPAALVGYNGACSDLKGTNQQRFIDVCARTRDLERRSHNASDAARRATADFARGMAAWREVSATIARLLPAASNTWLDHAPDEFLLSTADLFQPVKVKVTSEPLSPRGVLAIATSSDQIKALEEWEKLKDRDLPAVIDYVDIRLQTQGRQGSVFGFVMPENAFVTGGQIILFALLLYYTLNAQHVHRNWRPEIETDVAQFPWLGFHPGKLSAVLLVVSVFCIPFAIALLAVRRVHEEALEYTALTYAASLATVLVAGTAVRASWRLWRRNHVSPLPGASASDEPTDLPTNSEPPPEEVQ